MIIDERTYTVITGMLPDYVRLYDEEGRAIQWGHLGEPIGWFTTEVGVLNQAVHLWRYESFEDRQTRRVAMLADPDWQVFFDKIKPMILKQENRLLVPTSFSPIR